MQTSSQPKLLPVPFANGGSKQDIPNDSQIGITAGRASYTDGFPPLTRTPLAAGGVPPFGTDFNGVLNDITAAVRWSQSGAGYPFNADFNSAISGYPKGAIIPNSTLDGFWLNTIDGNTANPENTTSAITGWVPSGFYGVTSITGLSGSSVTLTTLQAGHGRITLAGTLTANINLVVPAWVKRWEIVNNCTGAFSVTVKTPNGTGVAIPAGLTAVVQGNGTNVIQDSSILGVTGRLIGTQSFTTSGSATYIPTPGTKKVKVIITGGGGGPTGCAGNGTTGNFSGAGGGAGGTLIFTVPVSDSTTYSIFVAGGGTAGTGNNSGTDASATTAFGCSAPGGARGAINGTNTTAGGGGGSSFIVASNATSIAQISGGDGSDGQAGANFIFAGNGGASYWGGGGRAGAAGGAAGKGYGSGGGAPYDSGKTGTAYAGGVGRNGICVIEEYS